MQVFPLSLTPHGKPPTRFPCDNLVKQKLMSYQYSYYFNYYIYRYIFLLILSYFNISSTFYHKFTLKHHILFTQLYFEHSRIYSYHFWRFLWSTKNYPLKVILLKIRLRLVSIDLIYFNSSYSLEVKHYIQGESSFLGIYLSFVKIKLILYFYITLHIEPGDPVECKYSRFHSSLQVEEYFCFTRY